MPDDAEMLARQQVLADFGELAIRSDDLDEVLTEACRLVGKALGTGRAKVLEIQEDRQALLVRAGVGWPPDVVGVERLPMRERSSESYAINAAAPVISRDIAEETRFDIPEFMKAAGVVALVNVPISVPGRRPYGVLQVDAAEPRDFGDNEVQFLRTYAMILGPVIDRLHLLRERKEERRRIRSSEVRHRLLVESWAQAVWEVDAAGVVIDDSPSWRAYTGQTLEEWLGYGWLDAIHPDDRAFAERQWREAVAAVRNVDAEFRLRAADGGWRWTNVRAAPVRDEEGAVQKWAGMNIDIDDRKRAETALRDSEDRYRTLFEAMNEGYLLGDVIFDESDRAVDVRFVQANPAAIRLAGRDFTGQRMREIDPTYEPHLFEAYGRVALSGQPLRAEHHAAPHDRWFDFSLSRVGPPHRRRVACVFQDITQRKRGEAGLRASEERQRALIEGVPQLVWRASAPGHWTWSSPQWTKLTGQSEEESRGWGWLVPVHPDDRAAAREAWARAAELGRLEVDHRIRADRDGDYRWFQTRATPLRNERGAIVEWLGTSTDVDDLRRLQDRQHVLNEELQHRTRNLMGVVRSMADKTARASADLPDFRERFRKRLDALSRVQGLLSRLGEHDRVTFDELIETELAAMGGGGDRVELKGPRGVRLRSSMVQTLAMAVHELATNAVKYGALGQADGRLAVTWHLATDDGTDQTRLHIDWRESGVAMPAAGSTPSGGGQGRELIEKALPYQLSARTSYELGPDGVHCTISIPVSTTHAQGADHG